MGRKNKEIQEQQQISENLNTEKSSLIKNLTRITQQKLKMQEEMLQKFVLILNAKKKKIRELKKQIIEISSRKDQNLPEKDLKINWGN